VYYFGHLDSVQGPWSVQLRQGSKKKEMFLRAGLTVFMFDSETTHQILIEFFTLSALRVTGHISCRFMPNITRLVLKSVLTGFLKNWATHLKWKIIQTSLGSKTFIGNIFQSSEYFKQVTEKVMCAVTDCIIVEVYQLLVDMKTNEVCRIMENTFGSFMFSRFK